MGNGQDELRHKLLYNSTVGKNQTNFWIISNDI